MEKNATLRATPKTLIMFLKLPASAGFLAEATLGAALALDATISGMVVGGAAGKIAPDSTLALLAGISLLLALRDLTFADKRAFSL